jgi:hypothetical protein
MGMTEKLKTDRGIGALALTVALIFGLAGAAGAAPSIVGHVVVATGVVGAESADGSVRVLGRGLPLHKGDVVTTGEKGFAVIELTDGSRMTLRPDTVFALTEYTFAAGKKEHALLRLFKGGLRMVSGLIPKRNPTHGLSIHTPTAVAGVRGTDFDMRVCTGDECDAELAEETGSQPEDVKAVAGRVVALEGELTARSVRMGVRPVVRGGPVYEKDIIETSPGGYAVIAFRDGSRLTLQSASRVKVSDYTLDEGKESVFFRLMKGGLRVFTGILGKRNPNAFRVGTPTAVVGVRGTGFDLRLCQTDCKDSEGSTASAPLPPGKEAGRVARLQGRLAAEAADGATRALAEGDPVFEGDTLATGKRAMALVVFRDDTRVTLQSDTRFAVETYQYRQGGAGTVLFKHLKGGLRFLTGLIARKNRQQFQIHTPTAVVGVRGSGGDIVPSTSGGFYFFTWEGALILRLGGQDLVLNTGQAAFAMAGQPLKPLPTVPAIILNNPVWRPDRVPVDLMELFGLADPPNTYLHVWEGLAVLIPAGGGPMEVATGQSVRLPVGSQQPVLLPATPVFFLEIPAPRPDRVPIDFERLFGTADRVEIKPGTYMNVYSGHVVLESPLGLVNIGGGEAGFAGDAELLRLPALLAFLIEDGTPGPLDVTPENPALQQLFEEEVYLWQLEQGCQCQIGFQ